MKLANSILTILLLIINSPVILGQTKQVGIIDFYGTVTNETEIRKCLPFIENDSVLYLKDSSKTKKAIVDCILSQSNYKQADISFVCCAANGQKWIVFVGADTKSKLTNPAAKTGEIKLSGEIISVYDSFLEQMKVAVEKGEAAETDSNGHSLMKYLPARQLQQKFIIYANNNLDLLREVLNYSKHSDQREVAATVIAYYHDKGIIVKDLINAVSDQDEIVRNNAVRAIGIIARYSETHPDLKIKIPAGPFIDMMNSISWTDRNKSSLVLLSLTESRDTEILDQLKQQALKPIVDMAKWKSDHHFLPGYIILGRMAGWTDQEIFDGAGNKAANIEKMLGIINNLISHPRATKDIKNPG